MDLNRERSGVAKRGRIDRPLPTDRPIRDTDNDGAPLDEIPLQETEERPTRQTEVKSWQLNHFFYFLFS